MNKFFPMIKVIPEIKIVDHTKVKWAGRSEAGYDIDNPQIPKNTVMKIQRAILDDETTLKRVIAHELIHHWQALTLDPKEVIKAAETGNDISHGESFMKWSEKINSVMGPDFVHLSSDEFYKIEQKEFYLLIEPHKGMFGYSYAIKPSQSQNNEIERRKKETSAKLFKSKDKRFLQGTQIKPGGKFSLTMGKYPDPMWMELDDELSRIYHSGEDI